MRIHLVGGFLGSGKTTAILQATRLLSDQGKKVGIVTNEQGKHLVDTGLFQAQSLPALEVTGGCICCHLDDFNERVDELLENYDPDVIFAESVGSCTDLVATVIKPLLDLRKDFDFPASLSVYTDARLFYRSLKGLEMPFSDGIVYIFEKQLEESELVIINKIDLLDRAKQEEILHLARQKYPQKRFRVQNSLEKEQVQGWLDVLMSPQSPVPLVSLDISYDDYAAGEQRFSWVDREIEITLNDPKEQAYLTNCILEISRKLRDLDVNIAHLKFLVNDGQTAVKYSITALDDLEAKLSPLTGQVGAMHGLKYKLFINAMLESDLETVERSIDKIIDNELSRKDIQTSIVSGFTRVPGYPKPTKRIGN